MEAQILQIIENYRQKIQNQSKEKIESHIYDYELARVILANPESHPRDMLAKIKAALDKDSIKFSIRKQLGKLRLDRLNKRRKWADLVKIAGKSSKPTHTRWER